MMNRLFWKTWVSLWLTLMLTYSLSGLISNQLRALDEQQALQERPWRAVESLAIEAERVADQGGDLKAWSQLPNTNRLGRVYLFDDDGIEINGRKLPKSFDDAALRPFARITEPDTDAKGSVSQPRALARTVFPSKREQPMTLVFLPLSEASAWSDGIPTMAVLICVGLLLTAFVAWLFSRHMVLPIRALFLASENVAKGNFSSRPGTLFTTRNDELAQLARRFDQMSEKLGRASEFQRTLLRDVSHELRSPLARIQVAAELAGQQPSAHSSPALARVEKEVNELEMLIEEILLLSRLDHDEHTLNRESTDLVSLVKDVVDDANFTARPTGRSVHLTCEEPVAISLVDPKLIKQAVQNVIENAVQHSPSETMVSVTLNRMGAQWMLTVCDAGPGVAEGELEAIFHPFYRSKHNRRRSCNGHGVGLALVAKITQGHGGNVTARNRASTGLEVTIRLPIGGTP